VAVFVKDDSGYHGWSEVYSKTDDVDGAFNDCLIWDTPYKKGEYVHNRDGDMHNWLMPNKRLDTPWFEKTEKPLWAS
jgi:hypothetical protein